MNDGAATIAFAGVGSAPGSGVVRFGEGGGGAALLKLLLLLLHLLLHAIDEIRVQDLTTVDDRDGRGWGTCGSAKKAGGLD